MYIISNVLFTLLRDAGTSLKAFIAVPKGTAPRLLLETPGTIAVDGISTAICIPVSAASRNPVSGPNVLGITGSGDQVFLILLARVLGFARKFPEISECPLKLDAAYLETYSASLVGVDPLADALNVTAPLGTKGMRVLVLNATAADRGSNAGEGIYGLSTAIRKY
jgi:hypothetical protein